MPFGEIKPRKPPRFGRSMRVVSLARHLPRHLKGELSMRRCGAWWRGYPGGGHCNASRTSRTSNGGTPRRFLQRTASPLNSIPAGDPSQLLLQAPAVSLAGEPSGTPGARSEEGDAAEHRVEPLWFDSAATGLLDALPLGNGRLGALVYGGPWRDRVVLDEESIVAGPRVQ